MTLLAPIQRHIEALAEHDGFPAEAVEACLARPDASVPILRALLQRAARGTPLGEADAARLFVGVHILAKLRDEQSFAPLMRLLGQPTEIIDDLLGDTVTASLPKILASTFDGDADLLFDSMTDLSLDEAVRDSLWRAATILVAFGRIDRERMRGFILRFDAERLAPKQDMAWIGWLDAIADLGFGEIAARVGAVWIDQRLPEDIVTRAEFEKRLAAAVVAPDDPERLAKAGLGLIDDVAKALAWADWDGPPQPVVNPMRGVGRNDPCPCGSGKKAKKCCLANG